MGLGTAAALHRDPGREVISRSSSGGLPRPVDAYHSGTLAVAIKIAEAPSQRGNRR